MLNMTPIKDANRAAGYFGKSDSGYYLTNDDGLHREWGVRGAAALGLDGPPTQEQLRLLLHGLNPHDGSQLTALLVEDRTPGVDFTGSVPKGVSTAIEGGDERIRPLMWRVFRETMADIEAYAMTRVRKDGLDEDRVSGNMPWLGVEHPDTRPTLEDGMPDWDWHIHGIALNLTQDAEEGDRWKACKVKRIFELRKFFSHEFDLRMSKGVADLGYGIETKLQPDERGGMRYYTWDIKAAPGHEAGWASINAKNSRRTGEIEDKEEEILADIAKRDPDNAPDRLGAVASSKLARTTRREKIEGMTLADEREYWASRIEPEEGEAIAETIRRARAGENPSPEPLAAKAMAYAIAHRFQRNSVLDWHDLAATAMERCMGAAFPEELEEEAKRQGVLFKGEGPYRECSTQGVLDQEQRIIAFARMGRGTFNPLQPGKTAGLEGLSPEQKAAVLHVWNSHDQVMLIRGGAGTGKTTAMKPALAKIGAAVELLAPTSDASRTTLRAEGFKNANTVASFLGNRERQEKLRNGGIIWIDEAGLLPIRELEKVCTLAKSLDARIILSGDPAQHRAVDRDGNMLEVLASYGGLPVAKLTKIQRQEGEYADGVAAIRDKEFEKADAIFRRLGWIVEAEGHDGVVAQYEKRLGEKNAKGEQKTLIVVDPTHKDGDLLTEKLRALRKEKGLIVGEEKTFTRLVQIDLSEAQKREAEQYNGLEVIQFFRNTGPFKAGQRVAAAKLLPHLAEVNPEHFAAFREAAVAFAVGDTVRITNNGWDVTGKHRLDNGRIDTIKAFTKDGGIKLANGWVIGKDFGHVKNGLVSTSPAGQSKTKVGVITVLNKASRGAMSARQAYVDVSRGREFVTICTDMTRGELLEAVARDDTRKSATELFVPPPAAEAEKLAVPIEPPAGLRAFFEKMNAMAWRRRIEEMEPVPVLVRERELEYER
jgi:conjugative relaxase-like TrwC/TraI family protein